MQNYYISLAGYSIKISLFPTNKSLHAEKWFEEHLSQYFSDFLLKKKPGKIDYYLDIKWDKKEEVVVREKAGKYYLQLFTKKGERRMITNYQISIYQFQIVLRYILHTLLLRDNGFLIHASTVQIHDKAYLFTGPSGAGKSTAVTLLRSKYKRLSDDIVIIKKMGNDFFVYQTPILEKNLPDQRSYSPVLLGKIFLLRKANQFFLEPARNNMKTFEKLLKQIFITKNEDVKETSDTLINLIGEPNAVEVLSFAKDEKNMIKLFSKFDNE